jgi:sensor histidine kinase regulating citrate/malate metabolism
MAQVTKIVQDHGGSVMLERSSEAGTVMLVQLPRQPLPVVSHSDSTFA